MDFSINMLFSNFMLMRLKTHLNTATSHTWDIEDAVPAEHLNDQIPIYYGMDISFLY